MSTVIAFETRRRTVVRPGMTPETIARRAFEDRDHERRQTPGASKT